MSDSTERLGKLLLRIGALNQQQIDEVSRYQEKYPSLLFGQIAIRLGYITRDLLKEYL